jgi:hypothetical protein
MEVNGQIVQALEDRERSFLAERTLARADEHVERTLLETRARYESNRLEAVLTPEFFVKEDESERKKWDAETRQMGLNLEIDRDTAIGVLADRIADKKVLSPNVEPIVTRSERLLEEFVSMAIEDKLRERCARQTLTQTLEAYTAADENTAAGRRLVVFLESQNWSTLQCVADPDRGRDADVHLRIREAITARQDARVPKEWLDWQQRLNPSTAFKTQMEHLRSGRGIALRPKPLQYAPRAIA